jgi:RNA polymerase sigma factor (sigma-70 family)
VPKQRDLTKPNFDELLLWLDPDRDQAALKYAELYRSLIRIFTWRGCSNAEDLADETVDRVAEKVKDLRIKYVGNPAIYFHSVANRIVKEEQRRAKLHVRWEDEDEIAIPAPNSAPDYTAAEYDCFDRCLEQLDPEDRRKMCSYYLKQGQAKIDHHRAMAETFGISTGTLRVRMYRIREKLMKCIEDCLAKPPQQ